MRERDGSVLPLLRPRSWPHAREACCHPLGQLAQPLPHAPWVTYVRGAQARARAFTWQGLLDEGLGFDQVRREALANLSRRAGSFEVSEPGPDGRPRRMSLVDELAAETILLEGAMRQLQDLLAVKALAVGIPGRGVLTAQDAFAPPAEVARLLRWTAGVFADVGPARAVSPVPLLVADGHVIGSIHGAGEGERLDDVIARAPTPPVILEAPEDRLLRPVAYFPDTQTLEMTAFLPPGREVPEAEIEAVAHLLAAGIGGRPVRSVRVILSDRAMALRAHRALREAGAEAWFMDAETGEAQPLARDSQPEEVLTVRALNR
jgi:hypothetical protein